MITAAKPSVCDLCGSTLIRPYHHIGPKQMKVGRCLKCGLIFTLRDSKIDKERLIDIAREDPSVFRDRSLLFEREKGRFSLMLKELMGYKSEGRLLDVGCGHGFMLKMARELGFSVFGVELVKELAEHAVENLRLDVVTGELKDAAYPDNFFDVVTMWNLLEHVQSPSELIREAGRILKGDGILSINVPNVNSRQAKKSAEWWSSYHTFHFSPKTLKKILVRNGFRIERLIVNPYLGSCASSMEKRKNIYERHGNLVRLARGVLGSPLGRMLRVLPKGGITAYAVKKDI